MGTRTIFEFNHDMAHKIARDGSEFELAMRLYLNSASPAHAEDLERFGIKRVWWGSSYDDRKVVTKFEEIKL